MGRVFRSAVSSMTGRYQGWRVCVFYLDERGLLLTDLDLRFRLRG
jgi:hypothetical protein